MRENIGIILAGGAGARYGAPKQFLLLAGRVVLEYSVEAFQNSPSIREIAVVAAPEYHETVRRLCSGFSKVKKILPAGKERFDSTLSALTAYRGEPSLNFLIHDAARPLVSPRLIARCISALEACSAASAAVPCTDTLFEAEGGILQNIPPRARFWRAQTPQAFHSEVLRAAFAKALNDPNLQVTDDCGIVRAYLPETPIRLVEGEERNIKLTYPEDAAILESLIRQSP